MYVSNRGRDKKNYLFYTSIIKSEGKQMNAQIQKVTYYIETHLDDELDVSTLAKEAGYSPYHFCRIFKLHIGESAMSYATRLKLERAASEVMYGKKSMIDIAFDAGYQTPTGFLKAFKLRFGTTPTAYQKDTQKFLKAYKELPMKEIKIVQRDEVDVVFVRETGGYEKSSDIAWKRLSAYLNELETIFAKNPPEVEINLSQENSEALGICHDDPSITDEANIRYDAAMAWPKAEIAFLAKHGFETKTVAGGKYAVTEYMGDYSVAEEAWSSLYGWIDKNGYTFRDEPAFEKYLNAWNETDETKIHTEVYVPID